MEYSFPIWSGDWLRGWTHVRSEEDAQRVKAELKENDLKVTIRRKYESFLGERMVRTPYSAKVYWEP